LESKINNILIVICGPTASGKTKVSLDIAKALNSEIISADSRQFFRELKIGVASPSLNELDAIKHHFVGHLSVTENYNVSKFETEVIDFLSNYFQTHKYALMVGGSGLYIDAVCKGIDVLPDPDVNLREQLKMTIETEGLEFLTKKLKELDPDYYRAVDLNNPNRIMRALEVCISTGVPYSSLRHSQRKKRDFKIIKIGLDWPRSELFERIEKRVDQMILDGLVEEVKSFDQFRNLNSLNTVGYKEIFQYFDDKCSLEKAIEKIKTNTRRYAKRQLTWFRKDKSISWIHPGELDQMLDLIKSEG
jgi:tRNA dimethylallyltransferase